VERNKEEEEYLKLVAGKYLKLVTGGS